MSYFKNAIVNIEANQNLRGPQKEAYLRIKSHFESNPSEQALVVLPTGTGKSGLICIAPYRVSNGKVLVITPGLVTKKAVSQELQTLAGFLIERAVILNPKDIPVVVEFNKKVLPKNLDKADFVISNIQQINNSSLMEKPKNFFDMIIVDESHHSVAASWSMVLAHFSEAKVLHLTGTPYRGDQQQILGKKIHETKLSDAMEKRFVKLLRSRTMDNTDLQFTINVDGELRKVPLEHVLDFEEQQWVEKTIALSKNCSMEVIQASMDELEKLKAQPKQVPHKILAVACGIQHAEDVCQWYIDRGLQAVVVHSKIDTDILEQRFIDIENHLYDVVVSVNMLMEGYSHKHLTVLAIFRPFRSLNAFAQIVGRVLRVLPESEINQHDTDNNAIIIYHEQTGLSKMWEYFKKETIKAQNRLKYYPEGKDAEISISDEEYQNHQKIYGDVSSGKGFINREDSFLSGVNLHERFVNSYSQASTKAKKQAEDMLKNQPEATEDLREKLEKLLQDQEYDRVEKQIDPLMKEKLPEVSRQILRDQLQNLKMNAGCDIPAEMGYAPKGDELKSLFRDHFKHFVKSPRNDGMIVAYLSIASYNHFQKKVEDMEVNELELAISFVKSEITRMKRVFGIDSE